MIALSLLETRVLGVLVEKQHTVPDSYPLTLNALVSGANQKTSRDPVIEAAESEVQGAIDHLKALSMVMESSGGRVMRYAQNVGKVLGVPPQSVALLATLFLRGPQTAGELRINSDRLHKFGDILSVEAFLNELAEKPYVRELPKQPGARETRWVHLLSGEPEKMVSETIFPPGGKMVSDTHFSPSELAAIQSNVDRLEGEVAALKDTVARLCRELGIAP
ncbi:MAG: YceH family protein [Pseudomonadota bacterium]|nr:YceH family protein [Pseudomonadota bacterium]